VEKVLLYGLVVAYCYWFVIIKVRGIMGGFLAGFCIWL